MEFTDSFHTAHTYTFQLLSAFKYSVQMIWWTECCVGERLLFKHSSIWKRGKKCPWALLIISKNHLSLTVRRRAPWRTFALGRYLQKPVHLCQTCSNLNFKAQLAFVTAHHQQWLGLKNWFRFHAQWPEVLFCCPVWPSSPTPIWRKNQAKLGV